MIFFWVLRHIDLSLDTSVLEKCTGSIFSPENGDNVMLKREFHTHSFMLFSEFFHHTS